MVARNADAIVAAADSIADETRGLSPAGRVVTIANGSDFDDFAGLAYTPSGRFRITHAGSFFGKRDPKPFLQALHDSGLDDVVVRFVGDFRAADRDFAERIGVADRLELVVPVHPLRIVGREDVCLDPERRQVRGRLQGALNAPAPRGREVERDNQHLHRGDGRGSVRKRG